ncbi:MAG: sigma factor-like helix-turn-helix DNA-binding protein [Pirellulaceae bacterium]
MSALADAWPGVVATVSHEQSALQECLQALSPKSREIVRLRYFDDLNISQVAERLGSTAGAMRIALMRIRRQLANCVERRLQVGGGEARVTAMKG